MNTDESTVYTNIHMIYESYHMNTDESTVYTNIHMIYEYLWVFCLH